MTSNRPHVILNVAMTADGKIDTVVRRAARISSAQDMARVERLRAESDAVMVGGRTLLGDDPKLTVKSADLRAERRQRGLEENPIKVGVVSEANLHPDSQFLTAGPAQVMLFTTQRTDLAQVARLREGGVQVLVMGEHRVDLAEVLTSLKTHGVKRLLVEGGGTLNEALLKQRLVDELYLYVAPLIFGGAQAPTLADGVGLDLDEAICLQLDTVERMENGGIVVHYLLPSI